MEQRDTAGPPQPARVIPHRRRAKEKQRHPFRWVLLVGLLALMAVIAIPAVGYYLTVVRPDQRMIVQVNDRVFTLGYFVKQLRAQKNGFESLGGDYLIGTEPFKLVQLIEDNELIRQAAPRFALKVTSEEIDEEIAKRLLPARDSEEEVDEAQLRQEYKERVRQWTGVLQLSESEYRENTRTEMLRERLRELLGISVPTIVDQVRFSMISLDTLEEAEQVKKRLEEGEEFSALAEELSQDELTNEKGGDVGWTPRRVEPQFDQHLFGLEIGKVSVPIKTTEGYYLIRVVERQGDRAHLQAILVDTREAAAQARRRAEKGEPFSSLAQEVNRDPELKAAAGDLGFVKVGDRDGIFDLYIRGLPIGEVSEPFLTVDTTVLLLVTDRARNREIENPDREILKTRAVEDWLVQERAANLIKSRFDSKIYADVVKQLRSREELAAERQRQRELSP